MPDCVTVKILSATVNVPLREELSVLESTEYWTVPSPEPLPFEVMINQGVLAIAVQVQSCGAVTLIVPFPPDESKDRVTGEMA